jgi:ABC-type lipoprotein release transport system permease subunit
MITAGALAFGGDGNFRYSWSIPSWQGEGPQFIYTAKDTSFYAVVRDLAGTESDTAFATIDFYDDSSVDPCRPYKITTRTSGGSQQNYIGGYEVLINDYDKLIEADDAIFKSLPYDLQTHKVTDRSPEIFSWLAMLDINVIIIIVLMIVISIVNMTSALLIIILERQQLIGTLKALGSTDSPIVRIFLYNSAFIVGRGILWGNIIGVGIAALQWKFHFIPLNPENYYVSTVPISLEWGLFLILDLFTIGICLFAMLLPAKYVTRISPIRSIKFN